MTQLPELLSTPNWIFSLDADDFLIDKPKDILFAYFGTHGFLHAEKADIILPTPIAYEKTASFVNIFGDWQDVPFVLQPPSKEIRTEWSWFLALDKAFNDIFSKNIIKSKYTQNMMVEYINKFNNLDFSLFIKKNNILNFSHLSKRINFFRSGSTKFFMLNFYNYKYRIKIINMNRLIDNFYFTHNITRASHVMALTMNRFKSLRKTF